jgi:hypothetical protein
MYSVYGFSIQIKIVRLYRIEIMESSADDMPLIASAAFIPETLFISQVFIFL